MNKAFRISIAILGVVGLASFGHTQRIKLPKLFMKNYAPVEAGEVRIGDERHDVETFYLCKHEVTNQEYREFLYHIAADQPDLLPVVVIDTAAWLTAAPHSEPMATHYHRHPAYNEHPVVNISYEAALIYCKWLTEFNRDKGLFAEANGYEVTYRLPERAEWVKAASSSNPSSQYAWGGPHVRGTDGTFLANFRAFSDITMRYDLKEKKVVQMPYPGELPAFDPNDRVNFNPAYTAPARSFGASELGFYHMNGNVAEMLATPDQAAGGSWLHAGYDIRNESLMEYSEPGPLVGFRTLAVVTVR